MNLVKTITPTEAFSIIEEGKASLIDIRSPEEFAQENIPGSINVPLDKISSHDFGSHSDKALIFHCKSGLRTSQASAVLSALPIENVFNLEGGLISWSKGKLPLIRHTSAPIDIMRQVQIAAGSLVLLGVGLGAFIDVLYYGLSAFVGCGLVFAGVSGFCGMGRLLSVMPWNRVQS